jgi:predicted dehydrogenase
VLFSGERNPTPEEAAHLEWRACDAESAFSALLAVSSAAGEVLVSVVVDFVAGVPWPPNGWRLYGDKGTLIAEGFTSFTVRRLRAPGADPEPLPVPQRLLDALPPVGDGVVNKWAALAGDFVADVHGEPHRPYLTFRDGWHYQEAIDAIRSGRGWYTLPV